MTLPAGACDTHVHFYDAAYPVAPTTVLRPDDATTDEYRGIQRRIGLDRVVVVQPTTYGLDNRCQLKALATLGEQARGVMVVDNNTTNEELGHLNELGVRGARFHMLPGGALPWDALDVTATHIRPFGWHIQLQMDGRDLAERTDQLLRLPVPLVIDHVGRFMPPGGLDHPGFVALERLLDAGQTWVKLSAPYESSPDSNAVLPLIDELVKHYPHRLLWASNWPHPGQQDPPSADRLVELLHRWLPEPEVRRQVLVDNPMSVYGFPSPQPRSEP